MCFLRTKKKKKDQTRSFLLVWKAFRPDLGDGCVGSGTGKRLLGAGEGFVEPRDG